MARKLISKEQLLASEDGRRHIAIALILYSDFRGTLGVNWMERAEELINVAEILGVEKEVEKYTHAIPKGQWELR